MASHSEKIVHEDCNSAAAIALTRNTEGSFSMLSSQSHIRPLCNRSGVLFKLARCLGGDMTPGDAENRIESDVLRMQERSMFRS